MEIIKGNEKMLSNYEVLKILKEVKKDTQKTKSVNKNLATITYETINYLESLNCYNDLKDEDIKNFLDEMKEFNLTKIEKLQILNHRPTSLVELQVLIEENEERFSEDAMNIVLEIVQRTLPKVEVSDDIVVKTEPLKFH